MVNNKKVALIMAEFCSKNNVHFENPHKGDSLNTVRFIVPRCGRTDEEIGYIMRQFKVLMSTLLGLVFTDIRVLYIVKD